jgi:hypothetical protein
LHLLDFFFEYLESLSLLSHDIFVEVFSALCYLALNESD